MCKLLSLNLKVEETASLLPVLPKLNRASGVHGAGCISGDVDGSTIDGTFSGPESILSLAGSSSSAAAAGAGAGYEEEKSGDVDAAIAAVVHNEKLAINKVVKYFENR